MYEMMCHQVNILDNTLLRIATFTTRIIFWTEKLGLVFSNRADLQQRHKKWRNHLPSPPLHICIVDIFVIHTLNNVHLSLSPECYSVTVWATATSFSPMFDCGSLEIYWFHYHLWWCSLYLLTIDRTQEDRDLLLTRIYKCPAQPENFSRNRELLSACSRRKWTAQDRFAQTCNPFHPSLHDEGNEILITIISLAISPLLLSKWFGIIITPRKLPFLTLNKTKRFESAAARNAALV